MISYHDGPCDKKKVLSQVQLSLDCWKHVCLAWMNMEVVDVDVDIDGGSPLIDEASPHLSNHMSVHKPMWCVHRRYAFAHSNWHSDIVRTCNMHCRYYPLVTSMIPSWPHFHHAPPLPPLLCSTDTWHVCIEDMPLRTQTSTQTSSEHATCTVDTIH
jgi:hypothetical protein